MDFRGRGGGVCFEKTKSHKDYWALWDFVKSCFGGPTRIRTWDHPVMSRKLCQLSYRPYPRRIKIHIAQGVFCQTVCCFFCSLSQLMTALPASAPSPTATAICKNPPVQSPAANTPGTLVCMPGSTSRKTPLRVTPSV